LAYRRYSTNRVLRWFAAPLLLGFCAAAASGVRAMGPEGQRFLPTLALSASALVICAGIAIAAELLAERSRRWERTAAVIVALLSMGLAVYCGLLAALLAVNLTAPPPAPPVG
jgi:hypothetical protein